MLIGIDMADGTQKDFWTGVVTGWIVTLVIDLILALAGLPFAGPLIGGFAAGYISRGEPVNRAKAGVLTGLLAAVVVTLGTYVRLVNSPESGFFAGWGTGLFLYLVIGLAFVCMAFLGSILTTAVRK